MSQIGLKALKVLGGAERPTDSTAQLSEAWLKKIQKINQVADNMETNNGVVKKSSTPKKQQSQPTPMMEQRERQMPINEILARTKADKIGINKKQVSTDDIQALLSGQKVKNAPNKNVETQYEQFIQEAREYTNSKPSYRNDNIIDDVNVTPFLNENVDIKKLVNEEVNRILFNEIFSEGRLKMLIESTFRDVIKQKAKEILIETFKKRKPQS